MLTFKTRGIRIFIRMQGELNSERLVEALTLLGERLRLVGAEPQEPVVCGGSSLIAAGFVGRLQQRTFGSHLTMWFAGRLDQIYFKLYAAADQGPGRHVDDLIALNPSGEELAAAARWAFTHEVSPGFRSLMRELLTQLGHDDVARQI